MAIIAIALGLLLPALTPTTARAVDGATRQFLSDLETARLSAISSRTHTRIVATPQTYQVSVLNRATGNWETRSKTVRFPDGVAFDPPPTLEFLANGSTSLDPAATPHPVIIRDAVVAGATVVAKNASLVRRIEIDPLTGGAILR